VKFLSNSMLVFPDAFFPENDIPRANLTSDPLNKYGYRCREFDDTGETNILFIGGAWTEGAGVEIYETYPAIMAARLAEETGTNIHEFNMGHSHKGYDYISRTLNCSLGILKPDFVFICFPEIDTREYFALDGRLVDYSAAKAVAIEAKTLNTDRVERELVDCMHTIYSQYDHAANAIRNYLLIDALLEKAGVDWAYSMIDTEAARGMVELCIEHGWMSREAYMGTPFRRIDAAAGGGEYPGVQSHEAFASELSARYAALCQ